MIVRRSLLLAALVLLALPLAACASKQAVVTRGDTEGAYVDVGRLDYQVQISRQLNPNDPEDRAYLVDVPVTQRRLAPDQAWFAVFMDVWNEGKRPAPAASDFQITDTQDTVYRPIGFGPSNVFAYRPATVAPGAQIPAIGTAARSNPSVNGALVLFKVKIDSFSNRPLVLTIRSPGLAPAQAEVDLDV